MKENYTVYLHTTPNGKHYVGITKQKPETRWDYGRGYRGQLFYNAINKYGWENIKHDILDSGLSKEEAEKLEIRMIKKYQSNERAYGYNVDNGGKVIGSLSKETKIKLSDLKKGHKNPNYKGKTMTQNQKDGIRERMTGSKNHNYGKPMSKEQKEKISNTIKRGNHPKAKKILCDGISFECVRDCAEYLGINYNTFKNYVSGRSRMPDNLANRLVI